MGSPVKSKLWVVYSTSSTKEKNKVYKSKYAADQLASKLQASAAAHGLNGSYLSTYLQDQKERIEKAGDPHKSLPKIDRLLAMLKNGQLYAVAELSDYHNNVVFQSLQTNLMSRKEFWEPSNTPYYCSPSSETYWST